MCHRKGVKKMSERIFEVEHEPGEEFVLRFRPHRLRWLPEETRSHIYISRKESLLALRSLIDRAIEQIEEREKTRGEGRTKVEIT
jgi:hypothetical protein